MQPAAWTDEQLTKIAVAQELRIAVRRPDGSLRPAVPIWVVTAQDQAYVRTWHRRDTGWFGRVLRSGAARISVPGLDIDVLVTDVGEGSADVRAAVDEGFRAKYGPGGVAAMVTDAAAATTLRLSPELVTRG